MNPKLIYITGGARSGKSGYAEKLAGATGGNVAYIATAIALDAEMAERIRIHRSRRPESWTTFETYRNLDGVYAKAAGAFSAVVTDCLTVMVTNIMLEKERDWDALSHETLAEIEKEVTGEIRRMIDAAKSFPGLSVAVSNEVGMGIVPATALGRHFRDIAGRVNQMTAGAADEAWLLVSGIPMRIK